MENTATDTASLGILRPDVISDFHNNGPILAQNNHGIVLFFKVMLCGRIHLL